MQGGGDPNWSRNLHKKNWQNDSFFKTTQDDAVSDVL